MSVSPKSKPTSPRGKSASPSKSVSPSKRKQESPPRGRPPKRSNIFEMSRSPPLHSPRVFLPSVTVQPEGHAKHTRHAPSPPPLTAADRTRKTKSAKSAKGTGKSKADSPSFETPGSEAAARLSTSSPFLDWLDMHTDSFLKKLKSYNKSPKSPEKVTDPTKLDPVRYPDPEEGIISKAHVAQYPIYAKSYVEYLLTGDAMMTVAIPVPAVRDKRVEYPLPGDISPIDTTKVPRDSETNEEFMMSGALPAVQDENATQAVMTDVHLLQDVRDDFTVEVTQGMMTDMLPLERIAQTMLTGASPLQDKQDEAIEDTTPATS